MFRSLRVSVVLLAVFAIGSVAHAASAATMSAEMALAEDGPVDMTDCERCGTGETDDRGDAVCDAVCVAPYAVGAAAVEASPSPLGTRHRMWGGSRFAGITGRPDPTPPRNLTSS